jgi:hypothetical protein
MAKAASAMIAFTAPFKPGAAWIQEPSGPELAGGFVRPDCRQVFTGLSGNTGLSRRVAARRGSRTMESTNTENFENFNERLSQWVASQGFWFQLRYSMSGSGMKGRAMFHLLRLFFRLLVFMLLVAIGVLVYLVKRTDSEKFVNEIRDSLQSSLAAGELETRGVQRVQGQLDISRLAAEGGESTFYDSLEARNIRMRMGLVDGLVGVWNPGNIFIARLEANLKAGTNDDKLANELGKVIFAQSPTFNISSIEIANATLHWGYSDQTRGSILNSEMRVQRTETGWRLSFRKGTFRQNWLRRLEIVDLVVLVEPGGLLFERAEFKQGRGTVEFPGLKLTAGSRPQVDGIVKIRNIELAHILPPALLNFLEGSLSGDFRASGSTNSNEGVCLQGRVILDGQDSISLRDRFHVLKALSVVDYSRNYRRVVFSTGAFQIRTQGGGLSLTEIDVQDGDLFTMRGQLAVRLPTQQEVDLAMQQGTGLDSSPLFISEDEIAEAGTLEAGETDDFTLDRAAQEAQRVQEGRQSPDSLSLFDRLGLGVELRRLQTQAAERISRMLRYEGQLLITLPADAFERAPILAEMFPVDPATRRVAMTVPVLGHLYELTLLQAEDIYQRGQR